GSGIGSDRPAHSPGKAEIPRSFGNASIGFGLTVGNLSDFVPHPELKPGSPQMDGDIENFSFSLKIFLQLSKDRCRFGRIPLDPKVGKSFCRRDKTRSGSNPAEYTVFPSDARQIRRSHS